ncbi:MAG TPA: hypothetical protein VK146_05085 [Tabrizicola sp.]|nr:hypothetical protein [Tabrizicola sp.]
MWTLETGGTERTLGEWRAAALQRRRRSQAGDAVTFTLDGVPYDADLPIAANAEVIIRKDGAQWFRGRVVAISRDAAGSAEAIRYQVAGPWWYLEQLVFQQTWTLGEGGPPIRKSHCLLNTYADGTSMGTRNQVEEALTWARDNALTHYGSAPFTWDLSDLPDLPIPMDEIRDITCAEVVRKQLRWMPDAVTWFDYSTSPPTFRAARRPDLRTVTLAAADRITRLSLVPRHDLLVPSVVLKYERVDTIDGIPSPTLTVDAAPSGATGAEFGAFVATIDLQGFSLGFARATIATQALPDTEAGWLAWLKTKEAWLASDRISLASVTAVSRVVSGDPLGTVLPRELIEGQIPEWMGKLTQQETVEIEVSLAVSDDISTSWLGKKRFSVNIVTTNATSGTFSQVASFEEGEEPPVGLAASVYAGLSTLEWEGSVTLVDQELRDEPTLGDRLNITGARSEWASMVAIVQEVAEDVDSGTLSVTVGPPNQLGPRDLVELLRVNRFRFTYTAPAAREGTVGGGGAIGLGKTTPKENSGAADIARTRLVLRSGSTDYIDIDAAEVGGHSMTVREVAICVDGAEKRMLILASDPYDAP